MNNFTEQESRFTALDRMSVGEILNGINSEDKTAPMAVEKAIPQIERFVAACEKRMRAGGRLFYIGAGTSGRLGVVDASELPPTFGVEHTLVTGLIAGGDSAIRRAVEHAEDNPEGAWHDLQKAGISPDDTVLGIAASGTTPYVTGGIKLARQAGCLTGSISCNENTPLSAEAEYPIEIITGPEFLTGSTRMKAGTAQKLALNMISTALMIRLGKVEGNRMVNMQLTNNKLIKRGTKMIMDTLKIDENEAKEKLLKFGSVKAAISKSIITVLLLIGSINIAFTQKNPSLFEKTDKQAMKQWVDSVFDKMTLDEKTGQLLMIITTPEKAQHDRVLRYISEQHIGGILFQKGSIDDEAASINLYQKNAKIPLLIALDGEWGLSMRLQNTPRFPRNMALGAIDDTHLLYLYGSEVGRECSELGIHINFAPVLDVNSNPQNPVIGTRSFGENPESVAEKAIAYTQGLESRNIISSGKHFPGHGDTSEDSHETLPSVKKNLEALEKTELYPFRRFIDEGFSGIMTGHLYVPALDSAQNLPSSHSHAIVTDRLQNKMGFRGLAFTDALAMKGALKAGKSVCVEALKAGNDILLNPPNPSAEFEALKKAIQNGEIPVSIVEEKAYKILQYKYIAGLNNFRPVERKGLSARINSEYADWLVRKLNDEAATLLKNEDNSLPIKHLDKNKIAILSFSTESKTEFQKTFSLYGDFGYFNISPSASKTVADKVFEQLKHYDIIVCGIHSTKQTDLASLQNLAKTKTVHLCFFTSPYSMSKFRQSISQAKSVSTGYEDSPGAQKSVAELVMGGIAAKGKLPVTVKGLFNYGHGLQTTKVRLSYQSPIEENMSPKVLDSIEDIVREGIDNKAFPGCQVLIAKNGVVVYNKSFGAFDYAGTHPVETDDIYDLASVTKTLATLPCVMKLYDQRKLSLTDPIGRFVPAMKGTDKENLIIRSLLFHESRLPAFLPFFQLLIDKNSFTGKLFSKRRDLTFNVLFDVDNYARTDFEFLPEMVSKTPKKGIDKQVAENFYIKSNFEDTVLLEIANTNLRSKNGYLYSDLNFILLKEAVEKISGKTLDAFADAEFYSKTGSSRTMFRPLKKYERTNIAPTENDQFWRNQILIGYPHDEAAAVLGGVSGNAGLFSNANDLAKMLQMFLNLGKYGGEELISESTVRLFTETKSQISRRGLGFDKPDMTRDDRVPACSLSPASSYGHTGYTGTCFWVDPDNQLIYVFLSNRVYPSRTRRELMNRSIRGRILETVYRSMNKAK